MPFFKKIQDWILKSERIQKRILRFFSKQINGASKEPKNPLCEWTSQEYRDTSGTFIIELRALNLKVRQLNVRQTIEKTAEKVKKKLRFSQLLIN